MKIQKCREAVQNDKPTTFTIAELSALLKKLQSCKKFKFEAFVCFLYGFSTRLQDAFGLKCSNFIKAYTDNCNERCIPFTLASKKGRKNVTYTSGKEFAEVVFVYAKT